MLFILDNFLPFYPPKSPKNEHFKKNEKTPGDIIILHNCTKNYDCRLYCSWDMVCDRCNCYFWFQAIFCPFTPLTAQRVKFQKNSKNSWRCHLFTQVHQKPWLYAILFLRYGTWLFFIWSYFLPFYPSNSPKKQNFKNMKKKPLEISSFYTCIPKIMIRWSTVPKIWCMTEGRTDGQTDRKSDI